MKKIFTVFLFAALLISCHRKNAIERGDFNIDSIVSDSSLRLTDGLDSPECSIHISVQYLSGGNGQMLNRAFLSNGIMLPDYTEYSNGDGIRKSVDSFVAGYLSDYIDFYKKIYENDRTHPELYSNRYALNTYILSEKEAVITYMAKLTSYGGGLYETKQTLVKNFYADTGKIISLNDIFIRGYEKMLKDIILNKFYNMFDVDNIEGLKKRYIFADGNIYVPDNFIIEKDGISFIYCQDEIAPHEEGEIRIKVNDSEIENLKKVEIK